jgi:hypothetical protein
VRDGPRPTLNRLLAIHSTDREPTVGNKARQNEPSAISSARCMDTGGWGVRRPGSGVRVPVPGSPRCGVLTLGGRAVTPASLPRGLSGSQTPIASPARLIPASRNAAAETKMSTDLRIPIPYFPSPRASLFAEPSAPCQRLGSA